MKQPGNMKTARSIRTGLLVLVACLDQLTALVSMHDPKLATHSSDQDWLEAMS
jgi:hypothetical protein